MPNFSNSVSAGSWLSGFASQVRHDRLLGCANTCECRGKTTSSGDQVEICGIFQERLGGDAVHRDVEADLDPLPAWRGCDDAAAVAVVKCHVIDVDAGAAIVDACAQGRLANRQTTDDETRNLQSGIGIDIP